MAFISAEEEDFFETEILTKALDTSFDYGSGITSPRKEYPNQDGILDAAVPKGLLTSFVVCTVGAAVVGLLRLILDNWLI